MIAGLRDLLGSSQEMSLKNVPKWLIVAKKTMFERSEIIVL